MTDGSSVTQHANYCKLLAESLNVLQVALVTISLLWRLTLHVLCVMYVAAEFKSCLHWSEFNATGPKWYLFC